MRSRGRIEPLPSLRDAGQGQSISTQISTDGPIIWTKSGLRPSTPEGQAAGRAFITRTLGKFGVVYTEIKRPGVRDKHTLGPVMTTARIPIRRSRGAGMTPRAIAAFREALGWSAGRVASPCRPTVVRKARRLRWLDLDEVIWREVPDRRPWELTYVVLPPPDRPEDNQWARRARERWRALAETEIDRALGPAYARQHPDVICSVMQSAASDYAAMVLARSLDNIALALTEESAEPPALIRAGALR
jgi:hypothetical protein